MGPSGKFFERYTAFYGGGGILQIISFICLVKNVVVQLPKEEALDLRHMTLSVVPLFNSILLTESSHLKEEGGGGGTFSTDDIYNEKGPLYYGLWD